MWLTDMLFPKRCPVCAKPLIFGSGLIHGHCQASLKYIEGSTCCQCGKPVMSDQDMYCHDCQKRKHHFDMGRALWIYDHNMQESIARYKYHGAREYAHFYVEQLLFIHSDWIQSLDLDCIIPVPVHWRKKNQRGYNQAELIALGIAKGLQKKIDKTYLRRRLWTTPQKNLTPIQRYENLRQAFYIKKPEPKYRRILLIDDIYTTGSTIDACCRVLKDAGAEKVFFLCLCIGSDRA